MEGSQLITINPATLDDENVWCYSDLQGLCKQLSLGGKGKRTELVQRLQSWHKLRDSGRRAALALQEGEENDPKAWIPLNVDGSNFSIFSQNIRAREARDDLALAQLQLQQQLDSNHNNSSRRHGGRRSSLAGSPNKSVERARRQSHGGGAFLVGSPKGSPPARGGGPRPPHARPVAPLASRASHRPPRKPTRCRRHRRRRRRSVPWASTSALWAKSKWSLPRFCAHSRPRASPALC